MVGSLLTNGSGFIFVWVPPFAFTSYFPGAVLLGKPEVSPWLGYASPLADLVVSGVASVVWREGLKLYQGMGT